MKEQNITLSCRIPESSKAQLQEMAKEVNVRLAPFVAQIIADYLDPKEAENTTACNIQDLLSAYNLLNANGAVKTAQQTNITRQGLLQIIAHIAQASSPQNEADNTEFQHLEAISFAPKVDQLKRQFVKEQNEPNATQLNAHVRELLSLGIPENAWQFDKLLERKDGLGRLQYVLLKGVDLVE